jgi:hypothetical protein
MSWRVRERTVPGVIAPGLPRDRQRLADTCALFMFPIASPMVYS